MSYLYIIKRHIYTSILSPANICLRPINEKKCNKFLSNMLILLANRYVNTCIEFSFCCITYREKFRESEFGDHAKILRLHNNVMVEYDHPHTAKIMIIIPFSGQINRYKSKQIP